MAFSLFLVSSSVLLRSLQDLYGQGKSGENISFSRWSGKVRESQGKSGNSTKKSGKSWKKSGRFFEKFLSPMNQDPLFFKIQSIFFKIQLRQVTCEILISAAELMFLCMYALGVHSSFCCWLILYCSFIFWKSGKKYVLQDWVREKHRDF